VGSSVGTKYLGDTNDIAYETGYVALHIPKLDLPETIEIDGKTLLLKDEFHVSLLYVDGLVSNGPISEDRVVELFDSYLKTNKLSFGGFSSEFRYVTDEARGRESVIAMCAVDGFENFAEYLSKAIGCAVEPHPTHVTLYTLQPNAGIGVNTPEDFAQTDTIDSIPEELKTL